MDNISLEFIFSLMVLVVFALLVLASWVVINSQKKIIDHLTITNSDITNKLLARDLREYAEVKQVLADPEAPLDLTGLPNLPGADPEKDLFQQLREAGVDPDEFDESLVGTVSGDNPTAI